MTDPTGRDLAKLTRRTAWRGFSLSPDHIETPDGYCIEPGALRFLAALAEERRDALLRLHHCEGELARMRLRLMRLEYALERGISFRLPKRLSGLAGNPVWP